MQGRGNLGWGYVTWGDTTCYHHSIIMQAVVDHNNLYRDVVIGWPGSVHDARVLQIRKSLKTETITHFSHRT